MPYRIKGTLKLPSGQPAASVDIEFISRRNYSPLLMDLSSVIKTTQSGAYDITLEFGEYAVVVYWGCNQPSHIGKLLVYSDTATGLDLQTLLQQSDWQPATPEYIQQIQDWLTQVNAYASQAAESAAAAKASENAVEADRAEVASNKTIVVDAQADVSAKSADVTTKAAQVAANTATVNEKTPLAVAAADTASQKAVDAAASDASARDAATRAENAALAMTGAILDGGQCDLSSGFYPQPLTVNGRKYSTVWYVQVGGTVGGIAYDAGDKLQYTTANSGFYFRIDARDDVVSVNGKKGAVTLNAQEVGADPAGTAAALVNNLKSDPNPFPQYSDFAPGEPRQFYSRAQISKRSSQYHPADGQLITRASNQGIFSAMQSGELPVCSDAEWLSDPLMRACFTNGDGSTTIRLPDLNGKAAGTVGRVFAGGDGLHAPSSGGIHGDAVRDYSGTISLHGGESASIISGASGICSGINGSESEYRSPEGLQKLPGARSFGAVSISLSGGGPTAAQTRPTSVGFPWAIKR